MQRWLRDIRPAPWLGLILLVAVIVAVLTLGRGDSSPRPAVQATAAPTTTSASVPPTTQTASTDGCKTATDFDTRARCFIAAWYLLTPEDSTASRQARIQPYASTGFLKTEASNIEVSSTSNADKSRITGKVTLSGQAMGEIPSGPDGENSSFTRAIAVVQLSKSRGSGSPEAYLTVYTEMLWSHADGIWRVESITDAVGK